MPLYCGPQVLSDAVQKIYGELYNIFYGFTVTAGTIYEARIIFEEFFGNGANE